MEDNKIFVDCAYDFEARDKVPGGFVELVGFYGTDLKPAEVARISYKQADKTRVREDKKLVAYLLKNRHTSPFEFIEVELRIRMPIFVARQLFRHRTASVNEMSMRYSKALTMVWMPEEFRVQDTVNKQGSRGVHKNSQEFIDKYLDAVKTSYRTYKDMLNSGAPKEQARAVLPVGMYTEVRWKQDFKNLSHLLALRLDHHAQMETRLYAAAIYLLLKREFPLLMELFDKYVMGTYTLTQEELMLLMDAVVKDSPELLATSVNSKSTTQKLLSVLHALKVGEHPNVWELEVLENKVLKFTEKVSAGNTC